MAISTAFCGASSSSSNTIKSTGTDFNPTLDCIPLKYKNEFQTCFKPAESVSLIHLPIVSGLSSINGVILDLLKSKTSDLLGNKYKIPQYPLYRAPYSDFNIALVVKPNCVAFNSTW